MIRNVKAITGASYLSMFFLGVSASLIGAAARNIGLSAYEIGLLIAVQNVGFVLSVSISGALSDTYQKPRILLVGSVILGFSFLTFYLSAFFWINLLIMFLIGVGIATYEGVTDAMLFDIHPERPSLHINVNHFFVTFGAIMITVYLLFLQMNWRQAVVQSGMVVLGLAAAFAVMKLDRGPRQVEPYLDRLRMLTRERILLVLFIAMTLAVGVEISSISILTTFLMELRGFSQVTSKIGLIVFLAGMATGRLTLGFFTQNEKISRHTLALLGLSFLFFTGLYFLDLGGLTYIAVYMADISLSAILPMMITWAGLLYPDAAGTVLGVMKIAVPLGGIVVPFFMSLVAKSISFRASLLLFPATLLLAMVVLFLEMRPIKFSGSASAVEAAD